MSEMVKVESGRTVELYGKNEEIQALGELVKQFAPWADKLDNIQIGGVVRRVMAMGLDPLNGHEVQIWKDNRNVVQVQPAYTLMVDWVKHFKGDHTQPRYTRLCEDDLVEQGLPVDAFAYKCTFIMNDDLDRMTTLIGTKLYRPEEVRAMFEVSGLGVSLNAEYNAQDKYGNYYFAPKGRSKTWKVEKRALVDAYRHKFGTPSRGEIEELRRSLGTTNITSEDWKHAHSFGDVDTRGIVELAKDSARRRETPPITREEAKAGTDALYGNGNGGTVEGVFQEVAEETPSPNDIDFDSIEPIDPDATAPAKSKGVTRPADPAIVKGWIERKAAGLVGGTANTQQRGLVAGMIAQCFLNSTDDTQDRHFVQHYLTGHESLGDVSDEYLLSLLDWLKPIKGKDNKYYVDAMAAKEAAKIRDTAMEAAGQLPLS